MRSLEGASQQEEFRFRSSATHWTARGTWTPVREWLPLSIRSPEHHWLRPQREEASLLGTECPWKDEKLLSQRGTGGVGEKAQARQVGAQRDKDETETERGRGTWKQRDEGRHRDRYQRAETIGPGSGRQRKTQVTRTRPPNKSRSIRLREKQRNREPRRVGTGTGRAGGRAEKGLAHRLRAEWTPAGRRHWSPRAPPWAGKGARMGFPAEGWQTKGGASPDFCPTASFVPAPHCVRREGSRGSKGFQSPCSLAPPPCVFLPSR